MSDAVNAAEWRAAGRMLNEAAALIERDGWQQGALEDVPTKCAATALEAAFRDGDFSIVEFNYAREALARTIQVPREPVPEANDPLDVPYWGRPLMDWNDAPDRTQSEVVAAFREAAATADKLSDKAVQIAASRGPGGTP